MNLEEFEVIQKKLASELENLSLSRNAPIRVELAPAEAFALVAALQLAWRHPRISNIQSHLIEKFAAQISSELMSCPTIAAVIEAGWNKGFDH